MLINGDLTALDWTSCSSSLHIHTCGMSAWGPTQSGHDLLGYSPGTRMAKWEIKQVNKLLSDIFKVRKSKK